MAIRVQRFHGLSRFAAPFAAGQWQALLFCSLIAAASQCPGWGYLLFPELAALSSSVLRDPAGPWASRPWQLVVLPVLCGCCGVWIARHIADPSAAVLLAVAAAKTVLALAGSPLVPALSAAALPVILQIQSWAYPAQIGIALVVLVGMLRLRQRAQARDLPVQRCPAGRAGSLLRWFALLAVLLLIERFTGLRYVLVPPLIVMAHEGLVSPEPGAWLDRDWSLPMLCGAAALVGVLAAWWLPWPALAAALSLIGCVLLLDRVDLRLPPLLALTLLPLVMPAPDLRLVPAVMLGAALLVLSRRLSGSAG